MDPFVAEIRIFPFNFAPKGWAFCDGQLLPLSQNTALFSILGTTYGGNGKSNFALPDLQGRTPMQPEQGPGLSYRELGEQTGSDTITLITPEIPSHNHSMVMSTTLGTTKSPANNRIGQSDGASVFTSSVPNVSMASNSIAPAGADQPHNNMQPYLTVYFCIALQGVFPPRT